MQLVRSGYSWSGRERNCVFLNCTEPNEKQVAPRFADVSAVSGLDFPDDGRSLGVVDWDGDGDLDIWFRNRTAPRLRLMRNLTNEIAPDDQSISLRLIGTTSNRDAIGARAELVLKTTGQHDNRLVRSIRAGDAFLSQSSKRLHFGIKNDVVVEELIIDWPGGGRERFQGISVGEVYEIKQGTGQAIRLKPRKPVSLAAEPYQPLPPTSAARIVLPGRVAFPPINVHFDDEHVSPELETGETPTLVTFWTSSCSNCRNELTDIARHSADFEEANLDVIAICLDGLETPSSEEVNDNDIAKSFLREIEFPFQVAFATHQSAELTRQFQNVLFSRYPDFVVPLSFLVDRDGQVVSVYRGAFSHETLIQDRGLVDLDDESLRALSTPMVGTWITKPATRSQFAEFVGGRFLSKEPAAALRYYEAAVQAEKDTVRKNALQEQVNSLRQFLEQRAQE
jgi:peroxiredoxin